jgi:hypothetical protein
MKYLVIFIILAGLVLIFVNTKPALIKPLQPETKELVKKPPVKPCPAGFILVPGSPLYQTSDFCIMKYDAKCADVSNLSIGLEPILGNKCLGTSGNHSYNTYKNNGPDCACTGSRRIVSVSSGFPLAYIPMTDKSGIDAETLCKNLGWHLTTNPEWMTVARNVEQVPANWCNQDGAGCGSPPGTAGKILANGFHNSLNDQALVAGPDDKPCFGTTTDGSGICGGKNSQKRTFTLSNGEIIWDFAGNVWNWVDATVKRKDEPKSATNGKLDYGWIVRSEFAPNGNLPSVLIDNGSGPSMGYDAFRPSNPAWNSKNGVGRIYHWSSWADTDSTEYAFIRGGNWKHGLDDGAFTIHLSPVPGKQNINDVGFRCVSAPVPG